MKILPGQLLLSLVAVPAWHCHTPTTKPKWEREVPLPKTSQNNWDAPNVFQCCAQVRTLRCFGWISACLEMWSASSTLAQVRFANSMSPEGIAAQLYVHGIPWLRMQNFQKIPSAAGSLHPFSSFGAGPSRCQRWFFLSTESTGSILLVLECSMCNTMSRLIWYDKVHGLSLGLSLALSAMHSRSLERCTHSTQRIRNCRGSERLWDLRIDASPRHVFSKISWHGWCRLMYHDILWNLMNSQDIYLSYIYIFMISIFTFTAGLRKFLVGWRARLVLAPGLPVLETSSLEIDVPAGVSCLKHLKRRV